MTVGTPIVLCCGSIRNTEHVIVIDFMTRQIIRNRVVANVRPSCFPLAAALIAAAPGRVSMGEMIDHLWGEQRDGGPDDAINVIKQYLHVLRRPESLPAIRIHIDNDHGWGWRARIAA